MRRNSSQIRILLLLAFVLPAFAGSFSELASATEVLDQSNPVVHYGSSLTLVNSAYLAQIVSVGNSGQLSRLDFWAFRYASEDLKLDIRPVDADLRPVEDESLKLGEVIIPAEQVGIVNGFIPLDLSPYVVSVDLRPMNLFFLAGSYFAFNLTTEDKFGGYFILGDIAPNPGPYAVGQAYVKYPGYFDEHYVPWTDGYPQNVPGPNSIDVGFRTFMLVPEPASGLLCAAGFFATLLHRNRRYPRNRSSVAN
jgi:hypothetical protein